MPMVNYYVMYKPVHPITKKPITYSKDSYTPANEIMSAGKEMSEYIAEQSNSDCSKNNMLFIYDGIGMNVISHSGSSPTYFLYDKFKKMNIEDVWCILCVRNSFNSAIVAAKTLIQRIGLENVKVCKNISMDIDVILDKK